MLDRIDARLARWGGRAAEGPSRHLGILRANGHRTIAAALRHDVLDAARAFRAECPSR
jgi:hypothetical protein